MPISCTRRRSLHVSIGLVQRETADVPREKRLSSEIMVATTAATETSHTLTRHR